MNFNDEGFARIGQKSITQISVSYTHLDVYKRQVLVNAEFPEFD